MERPRIFLLQAPPRGLNVKDAEQFGDFTNPLLKSEPLLTIAHGIHDTMKTLREGLSDYTSRDYIFPVGNPIVIGMASSIATDSTLDGCVRFLKWEKGTTRYIEVLVNMEE